MKLGKYRKNIIHQMVWAFLFQSCGPLYSSYTGPQVIKESKTPYSQLKSRDDSDSFEFEQYLPDKLIHVSHPMQTIS